MARCAHLGRLIAPMALVACATEPAADRLVGRWGAPMLGLVATRTTVELHLACNARARFRGPLQLDDEGHFRLVGRANHLYGSFRVMLEGRVRDAGLQVALTQIYDGGGQDISEEELVEGVTPDFPGVVCLAGVGP